MHPRLALFLFLVLVVGGGLLIGYLTTPDAWYRALAKPPFNPPGWIFGPVWTVLYIMIGVIGWRLWQTARNALLMKLWWAQLILNFAWSPAFFGAHQVGLALLIILILLGTIIGLLATAWHQDRIAAWMLTPYLVWVSFASVLNGAIFALN